MMFAIICEPCYTLHSMPMVSFYEWNVKCNVAKVHKGAGADHLSWSKILEV